MILLTPIIILILLRVNLVVAEAAAAYSDYTNRAVQFPLKVGEEVSKRSLNVTHFNQTITAFLRGHSIPGLSLAITNHDRLVYVAGHGIADEDSGKLVSTNDRFRLASVSKTITAIAIMRLMQEGRLKLTDSVFGSQGVLKSKFGRTPYSEWTQAITVQHLLEHSSGFVDEDMCGKDCDPTYLDKYLHLDQWKLVSALLDAYEPSHQPGTHASYSNFGYFILGRIVEEASGVKPYELFVKKDILQPMNVTRMRIAEDDRRQDEVVYYDYDNPGRPYEFHVNRRDSVGAWIATPTDLMRIIRSMDVFGSSKLGFLDARTRATMFNQTDVPGSDFAKGWKVSRCSSGTGEVVEAFKDGAYWGTNSFLHVDFVNKTAYAVAINTQIPRQGRYNGVDDLREVIEKLIFEVEDWPKRDLF